MPRRLFHAFTLLCAVLVIATLARWIRSLFRLDAVSRVNAKGQTQAVVSYQSGLHLSVGGHLAAARGISWDTYHIPPGANWMTRYPTGFNWYHAGFARAYRPTSLFVPQSLTPWLLIDDLVIVPYWSIVTLFALVPAYWIFTTARRIYRRGQIRCVECGYDLRATPERCPECGASSARPIATAP